MNYYLEKELISMMKIIGKKRGIAIYKQDKEIVGYNKKENKNQVSYRSCLFADLEIPIFSENFLRI